ncbi:MAG: hypothetical protein IJ642_00920 [Oscillospiraceae bacterium]|nr:hypothetical protein [Oscillospiraceae bacterium]
MRLKNILAAAAAFAFCTVSFASLAANAGEVKTIDCSNASALGLGDEGNALRRNIYNVWGNSVEDMDPNTAVSEYIKIDFTISGIGSDSARKDTSSTTKYDADGVNYYAFVGGSIAGNSRHSISGADATSEYTPITGDGNYTVTWTLDAPSENISCLYLQTNIDFTEYVAEADRETAEKEKNTGASGITITINSITSVEPDKEEETSEGSDENGEGETTTTTADDSGSNHNDNNNNNSTTASKSTTTTAAGNSSASTTAATAASSVSNTPTGDTSGVVVAAVVLTAAGAAAVLSRKKD